MPSRRSVTGSALRTGFCIGTGRSPASGLQAEARRARYALLAARRGGFGGAVLVTAHTLDDQAETLLMRLAHGSGPSGLVGMRDRVRKGGIVLARPLLGVPKARLVATAEARRLPFIRDPSNADPRFERVRWRGAMPVLAERRADGRALRAPGRANGAAGRGGGATCAGCLRGGPHAIGTPFGTRRAAPATDFRALSTEPEEIVLRVLALALEGVTAGGDGYGRLERLEDCVQALRDAAKAGFAIRRTLSGCIIALGRDGVLTLRREGPRRRGVHPATS